VEDGQEVHVLLKPSTSAWRLENLRDRLHVHSADITVAEDVDRIINQVKPTVIYHLATHGAYHYQNDAEAILQINVMGLWNLVRACNRVGYDLFVNTGSSSEYGNKEYAMRETDLPDPKSFYAVAKTAQSLLCQHVGRTQPSNIVTLRLFSVFGAYEEPKRLIPNLMMAALNDAPIEMVSPQTVRDFIHIDDVVDIYLQVDKL
jgi:nucleoside-diphosphate-sugar epimerase